MKITFGDQVVEVRPWPEGRALLLTRDKGIKQMILRQMTETPEAFELFCGDLSDIDSEDVEGTLPVIVDRKNVGLFFDLEKMRIGVCVCQEADDEESEPE